MKVFTLILAIASVAAFADSNWEVKKEKMEERTKEAASDTGRGLKSASRKVQDETCEMINGKMECAMKKTKHSIQNGADKVEDAMD
jgi:hypothetical protein